MTNSLSSYQSGARAVMVALAAVAIAACATSAKREANVVAADSLRRMPMAMATNMPMMQGMGGCPLSLASLALTPSQKATFDSVRTEHRLAMQRDMFASLARARAVLTDAQRVKFDSASSAHIDDDDDDDEPRWLHVATAGRAAFIRAGSHRSADRHLQHAVPRRAAHASTSLHGEPVDADGREGERRGRRIGADGDPGLLIRSEDRYG